MFIIFFSVMLYACMLHRCRNLLRMLFTTQSLGELKMVNIYFNLRNRFLWCFGIEHLGRIWLGRAGISLGVFSVPLQLWMLSWIWASDSKGATVSVGVKEQATSSPVFNTLSSHTVRGQKTLLPLYECCSSALTSLPLMPQVPNIAPSLWLFLYKSCHVWLKL